MERLSTADTAADESKQGGKQCRLKPRGKNRGMFSSARSSSRDVHQDLYETDIRALEPLFEHWLKDNVDKNECIGELFCGNMAIVNFLIEKGYTNIVAKDKYTVPDESYDFLTEPIPEAIRLILTNFAFSVQHEALRKIVEARIRFCLLMKLDMMTTSSSGFTIRDHVERIIVPCPKAPFKHNGKRMQICGCGWFIGQGYGESYQKKTGIATFIVSSTLLKKSAQDASEDDESVVDDDEHEAYANVSDGDDDVVYDSASEGGDVSENDA